MADRDTAKRLILGIISEAGGRFVGASRLNKAFWLAHLYHWKHHPGRLSSYPIVKAKDGPAIDDRKGLIQELVHAKKIEKKTYKDRGEIYILVGKPPALSPFESDSISRALKTLGGLGYEQLSEQSHLASWHQAKMGEEQAIYLDVESATIINEAAKHRREADKELGFVFD